MTANRERMYWHSNKEWWFYNDKTEKIELTEKAPPEAVESFKKWRESKKGKFHRRPQRTKNCSMNSAGS